VLKVDRLAIPGMPLLSFDVAAGECVAIEGPSGSGKTRILRCIADLDAAGGYVFFEGAERAEMTAPAWRRMVRYVSAEPAWWADTARRHVTRQPDLHRFERLLAPLGLKTATLDLPIAQLSTGERLRLGLARALADEPRVLLLDEPAAALDQQASALTEELIRFQMLQGRAIVLVSHDDAQIGRLAHKRLLLAAPKVPPGKAADPRPPDSRIAQLAERWGREP
jgi:ABC-type iron transport system FetAB ATPase subunit